MANTSEINAKHYLALASGRIATGGGWGGVYDEIRKFTGYIDPKDLTKFQEEYNYLFWVHGPDCGHSMANYETGDFYSNDALSIAAENIVLSGHPEDPFVVSVSENCLPCSGVRIAVVDATCVDKRWEGHLGNYFHTPGNIEPLINDFGERFGIDANVRPKIVEQINQGTMDTVDSMRIPKNRIIVI